MTIQHIDAAFQSVDSLCKSLRDAMETCAPVESLVVMDAQNDATKLRGKLYALIQAINEESQ